MRVPVLCFLVWLPLSAQSFRHERVVQPTNTGAQRLEVDLALLGAARPDLADLRLRDTENREIPYVLVPPSAEYPTWKNGRLLPTPTTKEQSGFELDLGEPVRTSRLRLEGLRAPFLKRFRLEGSGDREHWTELMAQGTLFDLPSEGLRLAEVDFPQGDFRYLRLVWDDRSSARMAPPRLASVQMPMPGARPPLETVNFIRRPSEPGSSRFTLRLPGPRLPLRAVLLEIGGGGPLLREARISESRLGASGLIPRELGRTKLRRVEREGLSAAEFRVPISAPEGMELEIQVEDGNNAPLDLKTVKVELEPQPWIYFESSAVTPLKALFGASEVAAPRYDLEVMREHLKPAQAALARWGEARTVVQAVETDSLVNPGPGAPLEASLFPQRRPIPNAPAGLCTLALDAQVLASSPRLTDLRILDDQKRQLPYLLEQRDEPLEMDLPLPQGSFQGGHSRYLLKLPLANLPAGRIVLETEARLFHRRVFLKEATEGGGSRTLAEATWQHADGLEAPPALMLSLPATTDREFTLEIEEGDNQPLPLKKARLLLPSWRLRFFHPGQALSLLYGNPDMAAPRYDLALLALKLRSASAQELSLAPMDGATARSESRVPGSTLIFWGVLGATLLALLGMLARLLKGAH